MNYGKILRARRKELGLTQAELSKRSGVSQANISRMETDRKKLETVAARKLLSVLSLELKIEAGKRR